MSLMINELVEFPIGIEKNYKLFQQRKPNLKKIENLHCDDQENHVENRLNSILCNEKNQKSLVENDIKKISRVSPLQTERIDDKNQSNDYHVNKKQTDKGTSEKKILNKTEKGNQNYIEENGDIKKNFKRFENEIKTVTFEDEWIKLNQNDSKSSLSQKQEKGIGHDKTLKHSKKNVDSKLLKNEKNEISSHPVKKFEKMKKTLLPSVKNKNVKSNEDYEDNLTTVPKTKSILKNSKKTVPADSTKIKNRKKLLPDNFYGKVSENHANADEKVRKKNRSNKTKNDGSDNLKKVKNNKKAIVSENDQSKSKENLISESKNKEEEVSAKNKKKDFPLTVVKPFSFEHRNNKLIEKKKILCKMGEEKKYEIKRWARSPEILKKKPFTITLHKRYITAPSRNLRTEERIKKRPKFDDIVAEKQKLLMKQKFEKEMVQVRELRKKLIHNPVPIPTYMMLKIKELRKSNDDSCSEFSEDDLYKQEFYDVQEFVSDNKNVVEKDVIQNNSDTQITSNNIEKSTNDEYTDKTESENFNSGLANENVSENFIAKPMIKIVSEECINNRDINNNIVAENVHVTLEENSIMHLTDKNIENNIYENNLINKNKEENACEHLEIECSITNIEKSDFEDTKTLTNVAVDTNVELNAVVNNEKSEFLVAEPLNNVSEDLEEVPELKISSP